MAGYLGRYGVLLLTTLAVVACNGAAPEVESVSVGPTSTIAIVPTALPVPSVTLQPTKIPALASQASPTSETDAQVLPIYRTEFTKEQQQTVVLPNRKRQADAGFVWSEGSVVDELISLDGTDRVLTTVVDGALQFGEQAYEEGTMFFNSKVRPGQYTFITPTELSSAVTRFGYSIAPEEVAYGAWNTDGTIGVYNRNGVLLALVSGTNEEFIPAVMLEQYPGIAYIVGESQAFDAAGNLLYERGADGQFEMVMLPTQPGQEETMIAYHEDGDFGMDAIDGDQNYKELMTALINSSRSYWQDLGVSPDYENVMAYLRTVNYLTTNGTSNGNQIITALGNSEAYAFKGPARLDATAIIDWKDIRFLFMGVGSSTKNIGNSTRITDELISHGLVDFGDHTYFGISFIETDGTYKPVFTVINRKTGYPDWENYTLSPKNLDAIVSQDGDKFQDQELVSGMFRATLEVLNGLDGIVYGLNIRPVYLDNPLDFQPITVSEGERRFRLEVSE